MKTSQSGEDTQIQIKIVEEYTYFNVYVSDLFSVGVEELVIAPDTVDANINWIEKRFIGGTD